MGKMMLNTSSWKCLCEEHSLRRSNLLANGGDCFTSTVLSTGSGETASQYRKGTPSRRLGIPVCMTVVQGVVTHYKTLLKKLLEREEQGYMRGCVRTYPHIYPPSPRRVPF
jgi:hypothetical protein